MSTSQDTNNLIQTVLFSRGHIVTSQARLEAAHTSCATLINKLEAHKSTIGQAVLLYDRAREDTYQNAIQPLIENVDADKLGLIRDKPTFSNISLLFSEIEKLLPQAPSIEKQPALLWRLLGSIGTIGIAFAIAQLLHLDTAFFVTIAVGIIVIALTLDMRRHKQRALRFRKNIESYEQQVSDFSSRLIGFIDKTTFIAQDAKRAAELVNAVIKPFQQNAASLFGTLKDASNLANLTFQVAGMPILDEEGALLNDAVEKFNDYKAKAREYQAQLALPEEGVVEESSISSE